MPLVVAHRGASDARPPGNTVAAFTAAVDLGADWVELDVRPTADGALAVHHDAELPDGRTVASVAATDLPGWVPSLATALDACGPLGVNVELKADCPPEAHGPMVAAVVDELRRRGDPARWLVTSFDWALVDAARTRAPELPTGLLLFDRAAATTALDAAVAGGHAAVNPWDAVVDRAYVERAHAAGVTVNVWTVDDPDRIVELAEMGADAVITNVPDVARRVLGSRGLSGG